MKAAVLKTVERLRVPGVRIPPSPPPNSNEEIILKDFFQGNSDFYPEIHPALTDIVISQFTRDTHI